MKPTNTPVRIDPDDLFDWRDYCAELEEAGYVRGAPGTADDIDGPVARACVCPHCDRHMAYVPMLGRSYLAFAVCAPCDKALEF